MGTIRSEELDVATVVVFRVVPIGFAAIPIGPSAPFTRCCTIVPTALRIPTLFSRMRD